MLNGKGLIHGYLLNESGYKKLNWKDIKEWSPELGILWIHLDFTLISSQKWLYKDSGLDKMKCHRLTAEDTRPRTSLYDNGFLISLREVNLNPGEELDDMISVRIWVDKHRIISTQRRNSSSIQDIKASIESGDVPKSTFDFFNKLSISLLDAIGEAVDAIDEQVDQLESEIVSVDGHSLRPKLAEIRRQAISIKRYLLPQREAFFRLQSERSGLIKDLDRLILKESTDRVIRYVEDLDESRERAAITQEELISKLSEQLNNRLYILSIVAVLFLPLTFITGLLGINVEGIPGAKSDWGFITVCAVLILILMVFSMVLKRYKWI